MSDIPLTTHGMVCKGHRGTYLTCTASCRLLREGTRMTLVTKTFEVLTSPARTHMTYLEDEESA